MTIIKSVALAMLATLLVACASTIERPSNFDDQQTEYLIGISGSASPEQVKSVIARGADVNGHLKSGISALHMAANFGNNPVIEELLRQGANINDATPRGMTPLAAAVMENHPGTVALLVRNGARPGAAQSAMVDPVYIAVRGNRAEILLSLIKGGADINRQYTLDGDHYVRPIFYSTSEEVTRLLLDNGASTDFYLDKDGELPYLNYLLNENRMEDVKLLLGLGANPNFKSRQTAVTPLHWAARSGNVEIVDALLGAGSDPWAVTTDNATPKDWVRGPDSIRSLLDKAMQSSSSPGK